jgi:hypothetical protein
MLLATPRTPVIEVTRRLVLGVPSDAAFALAADLRHDARWRREVHQTTLDTPAPGVGSVATEDAYRSARCPHELTRLAYVAYEPGRYVRCTAVAANPTWTDLERTFRPLDPARTELTYTLRFERAVVQQALGFAPPLWFLRWYTGWMMTRYLRRLQRLLAAEAGPAPTPSTALPTRATPRLS